MKALLLARRRALLPADSVPVWSQRLAEVARALGRPTPAPASRPRELVTAAAQVLDLADRAHVWLALGALSGVLPEDRTVVRTVRECELDGPGALWRQVTAASTPTSMAASVRVLTEQTIVDVNHTVATDLATGIQRVARETVHRWAQHHPIRAVAWTDGFMGLRDLTAAERDRVLPPGTPADEGHIVVPWRSIVLVPELAAEHGRSDRLLALARYSGNRTGVIGFDCVPLTSAETTAEGFAAVFFGNLAAVRHFDRIAAISEAAATEYEGWRRMLGAVGSAGPQVGAVSLPAQAEEPTSGDLADARQRFVIPGLPLVLVVGSHEPRKNHLAILHAAEKRWRAGDRFSLTFVGGNSWGSAGFTKRLEELQRLGRPVETASRVPDRLLWAAYRLARVTVFPSLNEGFGLPVAESLASGTPVITSNYGSMQEIAQDGGALLVNPRDDDAIEDALRRVLADDVLHADLVAAAHARPRRTWDEYAAEVWDHLTAQ